MVFGLFQTASIAVTRPLIPAGPILRGFIVLKCLAKSIGCAERVSTRNDPKRAIIIFLISVDYLEIEISEIIGHLPNS
jgi:hypothetical protein